jgi:superfamily I DNA/RNA helicase
MRRIVFSAGLEYRLPPAEDTDLDQVYYPQLSAEVALDWNESDRYDVLIVDEAQDVIRDTYLDFFDVAINGGLAGGVWRFFMDNNQDIYHNREPAALQRINKLGPTQFSLRINCRNTKPIAVATSLLARVPLAETRIAEGPDVAYKWFTNLRHQSSLVSSHINSLLSGGMNPDQITLLSAKSVAKSPWLNGLERVPFPIVQVGAAASSSKRAIAFCCIKDFKGLESDAVILTDIDDLESDEFRELIYVGTSRARIFLSLLLSEQVRETFRNCGTALGKRLSGEE